MYKFKLFLVFWFLAAYASAQGDKSNKDADPTKTKSTGAKATDADNNTKTKPAGAKPTPLTPTGGGDIAKIQKYANFTDLPQDKPLTVQILLKDDKWKAKGVVDKIAKKLDQIKLKEDKKYFFQGETAELGTAFFTFTALHKDAVALIGEFHQDIISWNKYEQQHWEGARKNILNKVRRDEFADYHPFDNLLTDGGIHYHNETRALHHHNLIKRRQSKDKQDKDPNADLRVLASYSPDAKILCQEAPGLPSSTVSEYIYHIDEGTNTAVFMLGTGMLEEHTAFKDATSEKRIGWIFPGPNPATKKTDYDPAKSTVPKGTIAASRIIGAGTGLARRARYYNVLINDQDGHQNALIYLHSLMLLHKAISGGEWKDKDSKRDKVVVAFSVAPSKIASQEDVEKDYSSLSVGSWPDIAKDHRIAVTEALDKLLVKIAALPNVALVASPSFRFGGQRGSETLPQWPARRYKNFDNMVIASGYSDIQAGNKPKIRRLYPHEIPRERMVYAPVGPKLWVPSVDEKDNRKVVPGYSYGEDIPEISLASISGVLAGLMSRHNENGTEGRYRIEALAYPRYPGPYSPKVAHTGVKAQLYCPMDSSSTGSEKSGQADKKSAPTKSEGKTASTKTGKPVSPTSDKTGETEGDDSEIPEPEAPATKTKPKPTATGTPSDNQRRWWHRLIKRQGSKDKPSGSQDNKKNSPTETPGGKVTEASADQYIGKPIHCVDAPEGKPKELPEDLEHLTEIPTPTKKPTRTGAKEKKAGITSVDPKYAYRTHLSNFNTVIHVDAEGNTFTPDYSQAAEIWGLSTPPANLYPYYSDGPTPRTADGSDATPTPPPPKYGVGDVDETSESDDESLDDDSWTNDYNEFPKVGGSKPTATSKSKKEDKSVSDDPEDDYPEVGENAAKGSKTSKPSRTRSKSDPEKTSGVESVDEDDEVYDYPEVGEPEADGNGDDATPTKTSKPSRAKSESSSKKTTGVGSVFEDDEEFDYPEVGDPKEDGGGDKATPTKSSAPKSSKTSKSAPEDLKRDLAE